MKAKKSRYQYRISEAAYHKLQQSAAEEQLRDGTIQGIAVCMTALEIDADTAFRG